MNEVLHANIFFVIASIGTVIFMIFVSLILWQLLKIMQSVRAIVDRVEAASDTIAHDVREFRESVKHGMLGGIVNWFMKSQQTRRRDDE